MLHKCTECSQLYLVSQFPKLCDACGDYLQHRIERLYESDESVEFSVIAGMAQHGIEPEPPRKWWVI